MTDVLVLCYHAVSPTWTADLSVTPAALERQMRIILDRGFEPVTFTKAVEAPPAKRTVAVTFDDGFLSVHRFAWPILRRLGVPATLYVPTALIGTGRPLAWPGIDHWLATPDAAELNPVSWEQLRELHADGWEIGSHTRTHPHLTTVDDAVLTDELELSKTELEAQLGESCASVAYPYGDVDGRVVAAAGRAGYRTAAALPRRFTAHPEPLLWPRLNVGNADTDTAFRRHTHRAVRALAASPAWPVVETVMPPARAVQRRLLGGHHRPPSDMPPAMTPAMRLVTTRGRVVRRREGVLAAGVAGRAGALRAYTLWPSAEAPTFVVEAGHPEAAAWLRAVFEEHHNRIANLVPAAWNVARARTLVVSGPDSVAVRATERALGRTLESARLAMFSPTGSAVTKATCFVFEGDDPTPIAVAKAMADPAQADRLEAEVEVVEALRRRLASSPDVVTSLPLEPLFAGYLEGEYMLVEPLDPLAVGTGQATREQQVAWLRRFQEASTLAVTPWGAADVREARGLIHYAWGYGRPRDVEAIEARVSALLADVDGIELPDCAVHGDYWRLNIAGAGDALRVYDWEWSRLAGRPLFDLWVQELAEVREFAGDERSDAELATGTEAALAAVEAELARRGLDERLARASLAPALAELSFRVRALTGRPGGNERGAVRLMGVVGRMLGVR